MDLIPVWDTSARMSTSVEESGPWGGAQHRSTSEIGTVGQYAHRSRRRGAPLHLCERRLREAGQRANRETVALVWILPDEQEFTGLMVEGKKHPKQNTKAQE